MATVDNLYLHIIFSLLYIYNVNRGAYTLGRLIPLIFLYRSSA